MIELERSASDANVSILSRDKRHPQQSRQLEVCLNTSWATSSGTKVQTIVILVPAEQGMHRLELRHFNFILYPSRTRAGP